MHAKSKYTNVSNGLPTVYLKRELLSTQNARGLVTCWFRFVCTRLIPTDNRLMDAGSTGSYFTARYESTNTDKSEARGLNTRNEEQVRIIMQCTDIFGQKWRFPFVSRFYSCDHHTQKSAFNCELANDSCKKGVLAAVGVCYGCQWCI